MRRIHWGRLLRRSLSLCMAVLALWLLLLGVGAGAAERSLEALGQNEDFVTAALRLELGPAGQESLPFWQRQGIYRRR